MQTPSAKLKRKGRGGSKRAPVNDVSEVEKAEMIAFALDELAMCQHESVVLKSLQQHWNCSPQLAGNIIAKVGKMMAMSVQHEVPQRRAILETRLEALFRAAKGAGEHNVCLGILRYLGKIWGAEAPVKVVHSEGGAADDWSAGRTADDLYYFAEHGRFPEERTEEEEDETQYQLVTHDPLERLN